MQDSRRAVRGTVCCAGSHSQCSHAGHGQVGDNAQDISCLYDVRGFGIGSVIAESRRFMARRWRRFEDFDKGNGAIGKYFNEFGECHESGRDQAHTQMGLGCLGCAAEIAWKQGVDLDRALDNRLALGFEYMAKHNLGHEVPYEPYRSHEGRYYYPKISDKSRGRFSSIYERAYHHDHDRMEMEMPCTSQVIDKIRPERWQSSHAWWGTLMHAGQPTD